jgi:hypothetical protein
VNQIVEKFKEETNSKKCKMSQCVRMIFVSYLKSKIKKSQIVILQILKNTSTLLELLTTNQEDLDLESVNHLIRLLANRKEELKHVAFIKIFILKLC